MNKNKLYFILPAFDLKKTSKQLITEKPNMTSSIDVMT